ncbi:MULTISPECIES: single-stranded DNA-binding protein [Flavobacterium]|uniref:Single-stranded DNA-binding protein n=1 Tax=Flavobacterium beibuense TaxID=657326 RepID=A0A444W6E4_9FLAO|nr:single-stranded DNA-binding protein [Flavobacterium beibuense]RYJ41312.1 Single-stranded DNA-binding protein [Flavobacterium beibuense]
MNGTLNKVMLIGHLGDDVKLHYFEGGNCIGRFPLATNEVYINKQTNEKITSTEWHNLVVRNKAAEICEKYLTKGDKIYIEGRIKSRQWQAEDGTTKYTTEIQVTEFTFLTTKKDIDGSGSTTAPAKQQNYGSAASEPARTPDAEPHNVPAPDDDLPF